ncbi:MAG: outer membrane beta-barrel protein [Gemmatimonadota bacterium]|jgi:hypothetical protein
MLRTTCAIVLVLTVFASTAAAQSDRGRFGFGVRLNPIAIADIDIDASVLPIGLGNFTVPILLGERARVEPELGILRGSSDISGSGFSGSSTVTILRYGAALHYFLAEADDFRPYVGVQFGFIRQTSKDESSGSPTYETKRTDNYLGIVFGGEYWFASRFSLGAEVQLNRVGMGDEEVTPSPGPGPSPSVDSSYISNNGVISVRFYL